MAAKAIRIAASILAADFARLGEEAEAARMGGADLLHVDVMDGHFVPNLTMGPCVVGSLRRATSLPLDVHLMVERPDRCAEAFLEAGANHITFHVEADADAGPLIDAIRGRGATAGLSVRPATPLRSCLAWLPRIDMLLIMTVEPGFGGQTLRAGTLQKIGEAARLRRKLGADYWIEVDGGIYPETIGEVRRCGAEVFVAGTAIFGAPDVAAAVGALRRAAEEADAGAVAREGGA